jgi:hypothetical protein
MTPIDYFSRVLGYPAGGGVLGIVGSLAGFFQWRSMRDEACGPPLELSRSSRCTEFLSAHGENATKLIGLGAIAGSLLGIAAVGVYDAVQTSRRNATTPTAAPGD